MSALHLARAAFAVLACALACLTVAAVAERRAVLTRRDWWLCGRWSAVAEAAGLAGRVLLYGAGLLLGFAAVAGT